MSGKFRAELGELEVCWGGRWLEGWLRFAFVNVLLIRFEGCVYLIIGCNANEKIERLTGQSGMISFHRCSQVQTKDMSLNCRACTAQTAPKNVTWRGSRMGC